MKIGDLVKLVEIPEFLKEGSNKKVLIGVVVSKVDWRLNDDIADPPTPRYEVMFPHINTKTYWYESELEEILI